VDNAYFGENWVLYLKFQASGEPVRIQPRQTEVILGRKSPESAMVPDVDLSCYGASERGVSRLHASVRRQDQTLVLSDLGSMNHTYINGQRVHPHEVRALHDGDELRLGSLVLYAYFRDA
jgi:pSer/pThr/pTyr-binding forkhead associated (FHA) protein